MIEVEGFYSSDTKLKIDREKISARCRDSFHIFKNLEICVASVLILSQSSYKSPFIFSHSMHHNNVIYQ